MLNNYLNHSIEGNKNKNRHLNTKESIDRESESNSPWSPSKKLLKNANNKNSSDLNFESVRIWYKFVKHDYDLIFFNSKLKF